MSLHRVLVLSPDLEGVGGVSVFARMLVDHLGPRFETEHFQIANRPGNRSVLKQFLFFVQDARNLKKKLRRQTYDIIHLNPSFRSLAILRDSYYLSRINKLHAGHTLVLFHGWNEHLADRVARNPVLRRLFQRIYAKVELSLVLCQSFKRQLEKLGFPPEKIRIVTTMYRQEHMPDADTRDTRNARSQVLFMARLLKSKGPYIMCGVAKHLVAHGYKDFRFIIAGEGPEYEGLRRFIEMNRLEDFVVMPGNILGEEKKKILATSDIFLLPSESEGCPIAMLEAMGAGMAVVARPVGAIPDIVESGRNGYLVDSHEVQPFYEAVVRLLEDRELLGKMQTQNRQKARENYDVEPVTKKIESLYLFLIQNGIR